MASELNRVEWETKQKKEMDIATKWRAQQIASQEQHWSRMQHEWHEHTLKMNQEWVVCGVCVCVCGWQHVSPFFCVTTNDQ